MSIWYRTGTVTVTNGSKNVVGVDTTFNTSIYPGDLFTVDENVFYEVADVTSNLNFTLQRNYAGTTRSGEAYVVVPLSPKRQLTAELAARVNILIERYRGAIEAWTAGGWAVDTNGDYKVSGDTDRKLVPIENGGGGLGTATKRWGQVHANSVTIAGQAVVPTTTPTASSIPIADSGGKIANGWIPATYFNKSNILGTVSQSGGVPTGAVIERGSNSNGEYVKFADGTLLCTKGISDPGTPTQSSYITGLYRYSIAWTLPATFSSFGYFVGGSGVDQVNVILNFSRGPNTTSTSADMQAFSKSTTMTSVLAYFIAIGRWF